MLPCTLSAISTRLSAYVQVFQGVILASRDRFMKNSPLGTLPSFGGSVTSPDGYLLALCVHECQRVFSDKMITLEDKAWIDTAIKDLCKTNFTPDLVKQVSVSHFQVVHVTDACEAKSAEFDCIMIATHCRLCTHLIRLLRCPCRITHAL